MTHQQSTKSEFFDILSIPKDASIGDIRRAYKSLAMKWHPDKNPASRKIEAETKFKAISQAYEALNDKEDKSMHGVHYSGDFEDGRSKGFDDPSSIKASKYRSADNFFVGPDFLPRSSSRRSNKPIIHSYSTVRRKLPPIEKKLECTLEELCHGCIKKIMLARDVVTNNGMLVREEELLRIKVKPGWKKGTMITFEGMGSERPGTLPADVNFVIAEKQHPFFKRQGNDLVLAVEIPLVKALTGCTLSIPLLGGNKMSCSFDDVIYPGYEKIIEGQGMPKAKEQGSKGNLRIKFCVLFPTNLTEEQRVDIFNLLQQSS